MAANRKAYGAVASQIVDLWTCGPADLRTWHRNAGTDTELAAYLRRIRAVNASRPGLPGRT